MSVRKITVMTFKLGTHDERARKIAEEALEVYAAFAQYLDAYSSVNARMKPQEAFTNLAEEIGDVITASVNFAVALDIDPQLAVSLAERKNMNRGRYNE